MISQEDANILFSYIIEQTGYSEAKVYAILKDYALTMKQHKNSLPDKVALKLRSKWGLTDTNVIFNIIALVLEAVAGKHVYTTPNADGRRDIHIESGWETF